MEKYYFLEMENEKTCGDDNYFNILTQEFFSKEEIENKKSVIDGIEYKIFTIEEVIAFLKQHPKRRVYKESLDIIEEEEIKEYLKNNINFIE